MDVSTIVGHIQNTVSPDPAVRKPSEEFLRNASCQPGFLIALLHVVAQQQGDLTVRLSAAVLLKNTVKHHWRVNEEEADNQICQADRDCLKTEVIDVMLTSPSNLQNQLSDVIALIGKSDFPEKWDSLLQQLVSRFQTGDFNVINGVLKTAHSLFRRYRFESRSDPLWREIKYVLEKFADPLTKLFLATMDYAAQQAGNRDNSRVISASLLLICKIFYSLNYQDIPEFFEDNMPTWMPKLQELLKMNNPLLEQDDPTEPGVLEQIRSQICEIVSLYACKYDEEFASYLPQFVKDIWGLLLSTGPEPKFDLLVSNAIKFLASVAERPQNQKLFQDAETLSQICEKIVIPNMHFRESDQDQFEHNPEEYIRRDIEGSDLDTRRRAACDLVRALCKSFEGPVINNFSQYVQHLLQNYAVSRQGNWRSKDAALYLVTSLAAKGQTTRHGVTQTTDLVNLSDFCRAHVLPELQEPDVNSLPVVRADCLKFLMTFRGQLPADLVIPSLPLAANHLAAECQVTHSYAAAYLEKVQTVRQGRQPIVTSDTMPDPQQLFQGLFSVFEKSGSEENDYAMKCLMRSLFTYKERALPCLGHVVSRVTFMINAVSKNPSKPLFNHYLFESLCLTVTTACNADAGAATQFETALFPLFQDILQRDVTEFLPYTFQVLALLLEQHKDGPSEPYWALFPFLLAPVLWERNGNVPALIRLLQAFAKTAAGNIPEAKVSSMLGVFQKLIDTKANDHHAFSLLKYMVTYLPESIMDKFMKQVLVLIFQRLIRVRTVKYVKSLLVFFSAFAIVKGADRLVELVDSVQSGMFAMVIESLLLPDLQKVDAGLDRRVCCVGVGRLLTGSKHMLTTYAGLWPRAMTALVALFELPQAEISEEENLAGAFGDGFEQSAGFGGHNAFNQLVFAGRCAWNPTTDVPDPKAFLAKGLSEIGRQMPGRLPHMVEQMDEQAKVYLRQYLAAHHVQLA